MMLLTLGLALMVSSQGQCQVAAKTKLPSSSALADVPCQDINGIRLSIALEEKTYDNHLYADEPVTVDLTIKNGSKGWLDYSVSDIASLHRITVTDESGKQVPFTRFGKRLDAEQTYGKTHRRAGSSGVVALQSGQDQLYRVLVNRQFDMTLSGTYTITATWQAGLGDHDKTGTSLVSNVLTVDIGSFNWFADDHVKSFNSSEKPVTVPDNK